MNRQKPDNPFSQYAKYSGIALQMMVIIAGGIFLGVKIDHWTHTSIPIFTVIFAIGSVSFAIYVAIKDFLK